MKIYYSKIIEKDKNFSLSSTRYETIDIKNKCEKKVRELLVDELSDVYRGKEVGSKKYVEKSSNFFIRTKALKAYSYVIELDKQNTLPIIPGSFKNMNLKKGDLIISKDGNVGEAALLDQDLPNYMLSSGMYKLPVNPQYKYYLLAFFKSDYFRKQMDILTPKGATLRHAKTLFLDCKVPIPEKNREDVISYINCLVKEVSRLEYLIKQKHDDIVKSIGINLTRNISNDESPFPTFKMIKNKNRLDSDVYGPTITNYENQVKKSPYGYSTILKLGFLLHRGQNLQQSAIGKSLQSKYYFKKSYKLILPKNISTYGTVTTWQYLGNYRKLLELNIGDIVWGAEGFGKGRSFVVLKKNDKEITNIHGLIFHNKNNDIVETCFFKCFLDYLRANKIIDLYAVGGNGGSMAEKYWDRIPIPIFPSDIKRNIAYKYYNPKLDFHNKSNNQASFLHEMENFMSKAGIVNIDWMQKKLQNKIQELMGKIINNEEIEIDYRF